MRRTLLSLSVLIGAVSLAGCANPFGQEGYLRDKSGDYATAETAEPIKLPEGTNAREMGDILVIPESGQQYQPLSRDFEIPRPSQRLMMKEGDSYSLERDGSNEWLQVAKSPAEVWPGILAYLEELSVVAVAKNPRTGIIETEWNDFGEDKEHGIMYRTIGKLVGVDDLDPMEDRFRFEVRNGIKTDTAEVHISHKGRPVTKEGKAPAPEPEQWNNLESRSQRLTSGMLGELLVFLARNETRSSLSLLAQDLDVGSLTELGKDGNGNPVLTIRELSFARAWAAVSSALDKAGLKVIDRNRSAGLFYLAKDLQQVNQPEEEKGFWSGLFGGEDDKKSEVSDPAETLSVRVSNYSEVVQLSVEENVNTSAPADVSEKLLKLIQENM